MKKNIAIILARKGSKAIKNKNLVSLNGKPLIYWSIKACLKSKKISSVWVSSDSDRILNVAKKYGSNIIKRPKKFASDKSNSDLAWLHAVKYLNNKKIYSTSVIGVQPTSPIRSSKDLDYAIKKFYYNRLDSMFSAQKIFNHFIWKNTKKGLQANYNYTKRPMRQDINEKYLENGSFYIFNSKIFLKKKCRLFGKIGVYVMNKIQSLEIDDKIDLDILESLKKFIKA